MITLTEGDILASPCQAIVNAVNIKGIMGAGLARAFARAYPVMDQDYQEVCRRSELKLGSLHAWQNPDDPHKGRWVVNFPTMAYPGEFTKESTLVEGFKALATFVQENSIVSIALPALGCGIGRYPWEDFVKLAEAFAESVPGVEVVVFKPH